MDPEYFTWDKFFADLSHRAQTSLRAQGIGSFESLESYRYSDLLALPGIGKTTANELSMKASKWGVRLGSVDQTHPDAAAESAMSLLQEAIEEARRLRETTARISLKLPLRDLFAMHAMGGILANPGRAGKVDSAASYAYKMADAMLAARSNKPVCNTQG